MKAPNNSMKSICNIYAIILLLFIASCNSLPEGDPPPPDQPIIVDLPVHIKTASNQKENPPPIKKPKKIDGKDAINYMLTSLATRCRPISSPGKILPEIFNRFSISQGNVNDLPMELWQRLIRNKMITPISDPKEEYTYILESEIEVLPTPISQKQKYRWKMKLIQNNPEKKEIWQAKFDFAQN